MIIGIHPDKIGKESYSDKWAEFLRERQVEVRFLDLLANDAFDQARQCDGVMWRWAHNPNDKQSAKRILYAIEHYIKMPVYPDTPTSWHYDEKIAQHYLLGALKAPVPKAWLFWKYETAVDWASSAPYPVVFKLSTGAGSSNVLKINSQHDAKKLIHKIFKRGIFPYTMNEFYNRFISLSPAKLRSLFFRVIDSSSYIINNDFPRLHPAWWMPEHSYAYFQEFLPGNSFDTRVTIIGNRAFAFRRMNRSNDFRASGSGNIDFDPQSVDERCIEIAFKISKEGRFQSMAYDFLFGNNEPLICEISYAFADWAVFSCPGHWDSDLNWIEGQMWPEEAQVTDFISRIKDSA